MKLNKVFLLAALVASSTVFTACNDDESTSAVTLSSIEGEYVGSATGTMVFISQSGDESSQDVTPQGTETATIKVDVENGTITLTQPTFYVGEGAYPGAIVKDIPLLKEYDVISFTIKDYGSMNGLYTVAGDIAGEYKGRHLVLDYTFKHAGQMVGTIHFEGDKK